MIILSLITVLMSSIIGGYIACRVLLFQGDSHVQNTNTSGGNWPVACDGIGPEAMCAGIGPNHLGYKNDSVAFVAMMGLLDVVMAVLLLWKVCTDTTNLWSATFDRLGEMLTGGTKAETEEGGSHGSSPHERRVRWLRRIIQITFHAVIVSSILVCLGVEFHYYWQLSTSPLVNFKDWGFGQIVGITAWFGIFVEVAYLQYCELFALVFPHGPG